MVITMKNLSIARKHIEKLYLDTCTVIEYREVTNPDTHITNMQEVIVYEKIPCKLSFNKYPQSGDGVVSSLSFLATILLSPDFDIKEGSKFVVIKEGKTYELSNSGIPRMGINHQEIQLKQWERWA